MCVKIKLPNKPNIIALYNSGGTKLVGYTYDAWGNCTTTYYNNGGSTGAQFNPFRYRGYYYNTAEIKSAGKQLFKRGFFNQQARDYYFKNAHRAGGTYVFESLLKSLLY